MIWILDDNIRFISLIHQADLCVMCVRVSTESGSESEEESSEESEKTSSDSGKSSSESEKSSSESEAEQKKKKKTKKAPLKKNKPTAGDRYSEVPPACELCVQMFPVSFSCSRVCVSRGQQLMLSVLRCINKLKLTSVHNFSHFYHLYNNRPAAVRRPSAQCDRLLPELTNTSSSRKNLTLWENIILILLFTFLYFCSDNKDVKQKKGGNTTSW